MLEQSEKMLSRIEYTEKHEIIKERLTALERWPFVFGILFGIVQFLTIIVFKFWR